MLISDPNQPHTTIIYYTKRLSPTGGRKGLKGRKAIIKRLKQGPVKVRILKKWYNEHDTLYEIASGLNIKQTYTDGEHYWELYTPAKFSGFAIKSIADLDE